MIVLDAGGVSGLAMDRAKLAELARRGMWPADVPAVVLAEALTGDHRRDHATNRLVQLCMVHDVDESISRRAAALRTATGRAGTVSAVDAVVAAHAVATGADAVLTSDPADLSALLAPVASAPDVIRV